MELLGDLNGTLSAGDYAAFPLVLVGGLVAGLNPCCAALYPAVANACCSTPYRPIERPFGNSVAFVLGLSLTVAVLGSLAVYLGHVAAISVPFRYAIAAFPILLGLTRLDWLRLPQFMPLGASGITSAFGTGLLLSFVMGPCATPVLASVLSYAAFGHNIAYGALLLFLFGLGAGLPLIAAGTATGRVMTHIATGPFGLWVDRLLGLSLIALGLYLLWHA